LAILIVGCNTNRPSVDQTAPLKKNVFQRPESGLSAPIEYILEKLGDYDIVMIGERHWTHEEPVFVQDVIKRGFEKNAVNVVFLEFGYFDDQGKIDAFLESPEYDSKPVIDSLRNSTEFGWGYQEYFDIFKLVYDENSKRPTSERVKLVLVDCPSKLIDVEKQLYRCVEQSPLSEKQKWQIVSWIRESVTDRNRFMADVIEVYLNSIGRCKAIYYAGSSHIRKDLEKTDCGRRYFSTGGILTSKYPGRVFCATFHMEPQYWQGVGDFNLIEQLYQNHGKSFAMDTNDSRISGLRLKSTLSPEGVLLKDAFDGYIVLNRDSDYQSCGFVPGFYDDEFARTVWERLRKDGTLSHLPPPFDKYRNKIPTGEEIMTMIKKGLH
jgi:hypothetical protein